MTGRTDLLSPPHVATETSAPVAGGTGWLLGDPKHYDRGACVDLVQLRGFIQATQPAVAEALALDTDGPTRRQFLAHVAAFFETDRVIEAHLERQIVGPGVDAEQRDAGLHAKRLEIAGAAFGKTLRAHARRQQLDDGTGTHEPAGLRAPARVGKPGRSAIKRAKLPRLRRAKAERRRAGQAESLEPLRELQEVRLQRLSLRRVREESQARSSGVRNRSSHRERGAESAADGPQE